MGGCLPWIFTILHVTIEHQIYKRNIGVCVKIFKKIKQMKVARELCVSFNFVNYRKVEFIIFSHDNFLKIRYAWKQVTPLHIQTDRWNQFNRKQKCQNLNAPLAACSVWHSQFSITLEHLGRKQIKWVNE